MSKHTPGPWEYLPILLGDSPEIMFAIGSKESPKPIARVYQETNARIIAAAPELFEACKKLLELAEVWVYSELSGTSYYEEGDQDIKLAKKAMQKAEGISIKTQSS